MRKAASVILGFITVVFFATLQFLQWFIAVMAISCAVMVSLKLTGLLK
jgi:hypothetical protein